MNEKHPHKDTIYIDVEDDITAVIDKMRLSQAKVVALVLPKRAATMQSGVNLKLLKRAAGSAHKNIVLITNDHSILPIAGSVGLHVAQTLQSKPYIPEAASVSKEPIDVDSEEAPEDTPASHKPIGELAVEDTIEVDNTEPRPASGKDKKQKHAEKAHAKKLKVPNFDLFRKRLLLIAGGVFLLLIIWIFAARVLPKASITITTDTSSLSADFGFTAKKDLSEPNYSEKVVPAFSLESKKTDTQKVQTTGSRDEGKKSTGTMTLTNCIDDGQSHTIPAGTGFTSGDLTFVTDTAVTLSTSVYSGGSCRTDLSESLGFRKTVGVHAISGGEKYNVSARAYSPPAAYNTSSGSIQASGSAMSGGTTKLVKIVSQKDIDAAKQAALDKLDPQTKSELIDQFNTEQAKAIEDTFKAVKTDIKSEPEVNKEASEVTVTVEITYSELGVKTEHLNKLVEETVKDQIDSSRQAVQNTGLDSAKLAVGNQSDDETKVQLTTSVTIGPNLDTEGIKKEIAGTKKGKTKEIINARPGIRGVDVSYSPFWVRKTPTNIKRINIIFKASNGQAQ